MWVIVRRLPVLFTACLLAMPAEAEVSRGAFPLAPAPAGWPGFTGLFRVPAPSPPPAPPAAAVPRAAPVAAGPGGLCRAAIAAAEMRHGVPGGLLQAIGLVESGRTDPATGVRQPWPWAVNAEGRGILFETRAEAVAWVRQAEQAGTRSIDTGCMQVNRMFHPSAFASLEQAFDPVANADYAARFLRQLKEGVAGGDWMKAAGFYHSQTPERAAGYRAKVQAALGGVAPGAGGPPRPPAVVGGGGQFLSNGAAQAQVLPALPGVAGRGLDAYRQRPVPVSGAPLARVPVANGPAVPPAGLPIRRGGSAAP